MKEQRQELVRLCFKGPPYNEHTLDTIALQDLVQFQKILTEFATTIWKKKNPDSTEFPKQLEDRLQFVLRRIEHGSAVVPLECPAESKQMELFEVPDNRAELVDLIYHTYVAVNDDNPLPSGVVRSMLPSLSELGGKLRTGCEIHFAPPGQVMTRVSKESRKKLKALIGKPYEDTIEIKGRVFWVDIQQRKFKVATHENTDIKVTFTDEQESDVTTALKEHKSIQLSIKGRGRFDARGVLQSVADVESLGMIADDETVRDGSRTAIDEEISRIFGDVTEEEWESVPTDLSHRHDYYITGGGKL